MRIDESNLRLLQKELIGSRILAVEYNFESEGLWTLRVIQDDKEKTVSFFGNDLGGWASCKSYSGIESNPEEIINIMQNHVIETSVKGIFEETEKTAFLVEFTEIDGEKTVIFTCPATQTKFLVDYEEALKSGWAKYFSSEEELSKLGWRIWQFKGIF